MPKHTVYTVVTPLPAGITRPVVVEFLHDHLSMIDLNPLVESRTRIPKAPARASPEEFSYAIWYTLTDKISYLPGGLISGRVSYNACFHDLPDGLQTHIYAPLGLDIREKWTVGGHEPGEMKTNLELGIGAPREGLYLREDVDMRCSALMTGFVKKNLKNAHGTLVQRLIAIAAREEKVRYNDRLMTASAGTSLGEDAKSVEGESQGMSPVRSSFYSGASGVVGASANMESFNFTAATARVTPGTPEQRTTLWGYESPSRDPGASVSPAPSPVPAEQGRVPPWSPSSISTGVPDLKEEGVVSGIADLNLNDGKRRDVRHLVEMSAQREPAELPG